MNAKDANESPIMNISRLSALGVRPGVNRTTQVYVELPDGTITEIVGGRIERQKDGENTPLVKIVLTVDEN